MHRVLIALAFFAACTHAQTVGPAAGQPAATQPTTETPPALQPTPPPTTPAPRTEVISEGDEPRAEFRYSPASGSSEAFQLTLRTRNSIKMGEVDRQSGPSADVRYECTLAVQNIEPNGDIVFSIVVDKTEVIQDPLLKPADRDNLAKLNLAMQGCIVNVRIDSQGNTISSEVMKEPAPFAAVTFDYVRLALAHLVSPLPGKPVGVGASWKVSTTPKLNGVNTNQDETFTLAKTDTGAHKLSLELTRNAEAQDVQNPNPRPGASTRVTRYVAAGIGEVTRTFDKLTPASSSFVIETEVAFTVTQTPMPGTQGFTQNLTQTVRHEFSISPR